MKKLLALLLFLVFGLSQAQTKVGGHVVDTNNQPVPFANIVFPNSIEGAVSDENGKFYLASDASYKAIEVSFMGFKTKTVSINKNDLDLKITLEDDANEIAEVVIYSGKTKRKGNPAIAILNKLWKNKKSNGTKLAKQYQFEKYEKIEFDMNNVDSTLTDKKIFKNIEFIFQNIDTSRVTGQAFLPVFINESYYKVYGKNKDPKKERVDLVANKTSGFESNEFINTYLKDLYIDYDIYKSYIKLFDKSFVSPISKTGQLAYNYVLTDSAYVDNKWCYNIIYYPRRKGEMTFKGDMWISDSTFAVKKINMQSNKSANINWIKNIYIEQEYDVLNDSIFLLKRDYVVSDFSVSKKDASKSILGKRTTIYRNYDFDKTQEDKFYKQEADIYDEAIYKKDTTYWSANRLEKLNKNEKGIYRMLDTLKNTKKFKNMYNLVSILGSGYIYVNQFDYGPIYSTFGKNDVEGIRLRVGGRTYRSSNDLWRVQAYAAYGFKDKAYKYGLSAKALVYRKKRLILSLGKRKDVEQIGVSLISSTDVLGRSFASSAVFASGDNGKLTNIELINASVSFEPVKNVVFQTGFSNRKLVSASTTFNMDYIDSNSIVQRALDQNQFDVNITFMPKRKTIGYGVERYDVNDDYAQIYIGYSKGLKGSQTTSFDYEKLQFRYKQPFNIGGFGRTKVTLEAGKTVGNVPLGLLNIIPGNQSYFAIDDTFALVNYYEFVADEYASLHVKHNFGGRLFSRIPLLKKMNLREILILNGAWGNISNANVAMNASNIVYQAPENGYFEYGLGVANILKVFEVDFMWRGAYKSNPNAQQFAIKAGFGFNF